MIRIDVISGPETLGRKQQLVQKIDVHYQGRRHPTEDVMFLDKEEDALSPGPYALDVHELVYPDAKRYGRMTVGSVRPKHLKRLKATSAASAA